MNVYELMASLGLDSSGFNKGLDEAESKSQSFGDKLRGGLKTAGKIGIGAIAGVKDAATALGAGFAKETSKVAAYGDSVDKMSQKLGMSTDAYQEWDYVLKISGTEMSNMSTGLKTLTNKFDDAMAGGKGAVETFERLGLSMEDIQGMSREDLFATVITQFQGMEDSAERAALANDLFGKSGQDLAPLFNTTAEETQRLIQEVNDLGGVMSEDAVKASAAYEDSMTAMTTSLNGLSMGIVSEFLPSVTSVIDGIAQIFGGNGEGGVELVTQGIDSMLATMDEAIPRLMEVGGQILESISSAVLENLPQIAERGSDIIANLITGVVNHLPQIISVAFQVIVALAKGLIKNFPKILNAGKNAIVNLANGIKNNLPQMARSAVTIIGKLAQGLISNAPRILAQGLQLMIRLASGIVQGIPGVVGKIPGIVSRIIRGFTSINWGSIGRNIISGIANGLRNAAGKVAEAAKSAASKALGAAKKFLGIESPSKVFRDQVGKMMAEGMSIGFERNVDARDYAAAINEMKDDLTDDYGDYIDAGTVSVNTNDAWGQLLRLLGEYLPGIANMQMVMSTGEVVGALAPQMNTELQRITVRKARMAGERL